MSSVKFSPSSGQNSLLQLIWELFWTMGPSLIWAKKAFRGSKNRFLGLKIARNRVWTWNLAIRKGFGWDLSTKKGGQQFSFLVVLFRHVRPKLSKKIAQNQGSKNRFLGLKIARNRIWAWNLGIAQGFGWDLSTQKGGSKFSFVRSFFAFLGQTLAKIAQN